MNYDPTPIIGLTIALWAVVFVYAVAAYVLTGLFLSRIFQKAGNEGWPAWVPVYNSWKMLELSGQPGWYALLSLVPVANVVALVFLIIAAFRIGKGFGKGGGLVALYIFLPLVWMALLAHGRTSQWRPELALPVPAYAAPAIGGAYGGYPGYAPVAATAATAAAPAIPSPYPGYHLENGQWVADVAPVAAAAVPVTEPEPAFEPVPAPVSDAGLTVDSAAADATAADATAADATAADAPATEAPATEAPATEAPAAESVAPAVSEPSPYPGYHLENGQWVADAAPVAATPVTAVSEPSPYPGWHLENGQWVADAAPAPAAAVAEPSPYPGWHLENGQWVADAAPAPAAPVAAVAEPSPYPGYHLENGQWVPDVAPAAAASPYPGYHLENGQWVPDAAPQHPWAPPQA
ncbi:DUF5684 domain-containing protein [Agromyces sp. LHK192]|uniref:DUF5684 domain-containing protein n=1 Tax=Agromyces sp. LHK192 TaxID=2498704 RepID=UPI000FD87C8D|nr:DUF5684 domain-containing protein [Agromyces sp. LHK192]